MVGMRRSRTSLAIVAAALLAGMAAPATAEACPWAYPVGDSAASPAPLFNGHPVGGGNLPHLGVHLGADYWSGGGCTDLGRTVYAAADGEIVEIVDGLGSYLDVVVIRHEDASAGTVYSMYGHISREAGLAEGQPVDYRQPIGFIDDVLAYFSPCHLHFEILNEQAYQQGPFCNGCAAAGFSVSPGYDQQAGVTAGMDPSGDTWLEVDDGIANNRWYHTDAFIDARLDATCGECGDGVCEGNETYDECPADCPPCALIPAEGGTLDETGACFFGGGDPAYWYTEKSGFESSRLWTHTTDSTVVDNHGIWSLAFAEAGLYRLEAWIEPGSADTQMASYQVRHADTMDTVVANQSTADGWLMLAEFEFAAGGDQWIRLDDNTGEAFSTMTRIVFDGIRLTRLDLPPGGSESGMPPATTDGDSGADESGAVGTSENPPGEEETGDSATSSPGGGGSGPAIPGARESEDFGCTCHEGRDTPPWWGVLVLAAIRRRRSRPAIVQRR